MNVVRYITDVKTLFKLLLLSEHIWIKCDDDMFKGPSGYLKGILKA